MFRLKGEVLQELKSGRWRPVRLPLTPEKMHEIVRYLLKLAKIQEDRYEREM